VTLNADGSFTYTPDAGFTGPDSFTYTLTDAGLDGNFATLGDNLSSTGTVTLNVQNTVWFIDNTAPGSLNLGTRQSVTSIAAFNAVNDGVGFTRRRRHRLPARRHLYRGRWHQPAEQPDPRAGREPRRQPLAGRPTSRSRPAQWARRRSSS
jgi:hypothetical protein